MRITIELSSTERRVGAILLGVFATIFTSVALADVPRTFSSGETLRAADLNENFAALDERLATLTNALADLDVRTGVLESNQIVTVETASPGDPGYDDCLDQTGIFVPGACARMAHNTCVERGHFSGWFEGDLLNGVNIGIRCIEQAIVR